MEQFNRELDKAIKELRINSSEWQRLVKSLIKMIPEQREELRKDLQLLASTSMAGVDRRIHCNSDFFAARAARGLQLIKSSIDPTYRAPTPTPTICEVSPQSILLDANKAEQVVYLSGYDLGPTRADLRVALVKSSGEKTRANSLLTVNSGYQATLNLHELRPGGAFGDSKPATIEILAGEQVIARVVVTHPGPKKIVHKIASSDLTVVPRLVRGDRELATRGGPTHANAKVRLELRANSTELWLIASMWVQEQQGDKTEAQNESEHRIHIAKNGKIERILTDRSWESGPIVVRHFEVLNRGSSLPTSLVRRADCYVDNNRDDIEAYTRTEFTFNEIEIELTEQPE